MEAIKDLKKATVKWRKTRDEYLDLSTSTPKTKLPGQGFSLEEYLPSTPEADTSEAVWTNLCSGATARVSRPVG